VFLFHKPIKLQLHMKLFLLLIVTFMIPLVVLSTIFIRSYNELTVKNAIDSVVDGHTRLNNLLTSEFELIEGAGNMLFVDSELISCIEDYQSGMITSKETSQKIRTIVNQLTPYFDTHKPDIAIVNTTGDLLGGSYLSHYFQIPELTEFLDNYFANTSMPLDTLWVLDSDLLGTDSNSPKSIYAFHKLLSSDSTTVCGAIVFRIPQNALLRIYMPATADYQNMHLLTESGKTILNYENISFSDNLISQYYDTVVKYSSSLQTTVEGRSILIQSTTLDPTLWHVVSFSDLDQVLSAYNRVNTGYYIALIICAVLSLILSYVFSHRFTRPIINLHKQLQQLEEGNLSAHVEIDSNDEIGELSIQFNSAVVKIQSLMDQLVAEQEDKRKADMNALQAQINPHFIFNTLTSVRSLIYSDQRANADMIIVSLNKLMKYALSDAQTMVSVNLEIEQLNNYLRIQKMSLADSFELVIDIEKAIGNCLIMKLLLQPLVENAILHGLKLKKDSPRLEIKGYTTGNDIEFVISDNGVGFDPSQLSLLSQNQSTRGHGIGLANVDRRIKLHFGNQYGLRIQSQVGEGTSAYVRIPKITKEEEYHAYDYFIG